MDKDNLPQPIVFLFFKGGNRGSMKLKVRTEFTVSSCEAGSFVTWIKAGILHIVHAAIHGLYIVHTMPGAFYGSGVF